MTVYKKLLVLTVFGISENFQIQRFREMRIFLTGFLFVYNKLPTPPTLNI